MYNARHCQYILVSTSCAFVGVFGINLVRVTARYRWKIGQKTIGHSCPDTVQQQAHNTQEISLPILNQISASSSANKKLHSQRKIMLSQHACMSLNSGITAVFLAWPSTSTISHRNLGVHCKCNCLKYK